LCAKAKFTRGPFINGAFDGGSSASLGTAGYVIALSTCEEVVRKGIFLGPGYTVNEAEVNALYHLIKDVVELTATG